MWRTAKTLDDDVGEDNTTSSEIEQSDRGDPVIFDLSVPTNAFQPKMADGVATPTTQQRLGSFLAPVPALFKAGTIASCVGYGITTILIGLRTLLRSSDTAHSLISDGNHPGERPVCFRLHGMLHGGRQQPAVSDFAGTRRTHSD